MQPTSTTAARLSQPQPKRAIRSNHGANSISNFSHLLGSQIRYLVTNLNKKNFKSSAAEIHHLIDLYGHDAYLYLLRALITNIDFRDPKQKDILRVQLLNQEIALLMKQTNFATTICQALEGLENLQDDFVQHFSKVVKISPGQEVLVALGLAHADQSSIKLEGLKFLKNVELNQNLLKNLPENILHSLLYVLRSEGLIKQAQAMLKIVPKLSPVPHALTPLFADGFAPNSKEKEFTKSDPLLAEIVGTCNIASMMEDLGYACCETPASFKELLAQFPELKETDVAQILGMLARTHSSLEGQGVAFYKDFPPTTDFTVSEKVEQPPKSWKIEVIIDVIRELYPKLNWPQVVKCLDYPGFSVPDPKGLALLMTVYRKASKDPFPLEYLFEIWKNTSGQLSFLKHAVAAPPDMFNIGATLRRIDADGLPTVGKGALHQTWYSLSLIETLLKLAEVENYGVVRQAFNYPIKHCPELLCIGIAQATKTSWGNLAGELCGVLMHNILLSNNAASNFTIHKIWQHNPIMLIRGMVEVYTKDQSTLSRLLEIATQDLKALTAILDAKPFFFVIDLAALASRREFLNLEKWLQDKIAENGLPFIKACFQHMRDRLLKNPKTESNQRLFDTLFIFYTCLQAIASTLPTDLLEELKAMGPKFQSFQKQKMHEDAFPAPVPVVSAPPLVHSVTPPIPATPPDVPQLDPKGTPFLMPGTAAMKSLPPGVGNPQQNLVQPGLGQGPSGNPTGETRVFPPEVEEMANAYFQKIYTGQISIDEIVTLLTKFKNSKEKREQDIFACMIHNLFDEYRFFPKYPDKELQITGLLFGSLIQHQLVSFLPLGVALRYVLDALRKPPGSKMFKFGITALEQFKARLPEWPQYCSHILAIPPIHKFHPEIIEFIETHINSQSPGTAPANPSSGPGLTSAHPATPSPPLATTTPPPGLANVNAPIHVAPVGVPPSAPEKEPSKPTPTTPVKKEEKKDSLPIDILLRNVTAPPAIDVAVMDKIAFVYNNVSLSNLDPKVAELKALLKDDDCIKYTAWYLICKRICLEFNFHSLYTAVLDKLKLPKLNNYLLSNTLEAIKALLASSTITTSFEEKTLLKNLGSWLGLITLGKNKPLLQRDLGLKELLFEAYENGRLIVVIPFVCKVLETCANSKVFKPPNPWVMAIMRLLAEIYNKQNLRLSLKFEVELLCKALSIDMKELKPSDSLKDHNQYTGPGNLDFNPPPQPPPRAPSPVVEPPISMPLPPSQPDTPQPLPDIPLNEPEHDEPFLDVLGNYLVISPAIPLFSQQPQLKRCVSVAVDRAIREIISPVVERSVTIATITTREMVLKDFAMEPDEQKMRKAAHLMVQNLAGSLALVTCKEPLRVSMNTHLRSLLQASTPEQYHPLVEQAVQMVSNDNLDLACTLIEKAATEKAVRDTDEALTTAFVARKKHRERGGMGQPYYDINFTTGRYPSTLPESLRPKLGGLQPHQLRVFDDFSRIPHIQASQMGLSQAEDSRGPVDPSEALSTQQALEKLNLILNDLDNASLRNPIPLSSLPQDHDAFKLLQQVPIIINQSISRTEIAVAFAQKVFKTLFDSDVPLYQDVRFFILNSISELNPKIVKEITSWLFYFDDERKFHRHITPRLIISHLISLPDFDSQLAKLIETGRSKASLDFSVFIIRQGILEARYVSPNDLRETLELLSKLARSKGAEELMKLLEEVKTKALMGIVKQDDKPKKLSREASRDDSLAKPTLRTQISSDFSDPPGTKEEVIRIFDEWLAVYTQTIQTDSQNKLLLANHITQLQSHAIFKDDDSSSRFFRICTELAIENSYIPEKQAVSYVAVDAFSKLVVFLVKLSENPNTKIALLSRVLGVVVRVLIRDYDMKKSKFSQRSYFRLFANWLIDLNVPDPTLDPINLQILLAFSNAFMMMQPSRLPGFSFAWLEMVSHRMFMPKLLLTKSQKGWPLFQRLLTELFKFLEPYLRNAELSEPIRMLYKGTLRVLLVLLHDFPEFLCDYHFSFCDVIPPSCIQMRNLILSAFPRNMRLPDPFTPNLKVDLLPEINQSPRILSNYIPHLGQDLYNQVDNYLKNRSPVSFLLDLKSRLMLSNQEALATGTKYNVPVINALVLHVGIQAIAQLQNKSPNQLAPPIAQSAPMDIFQHLVVDLDTEGRYLLLNAIANQLRYPNNHTHYFSCVLLYLFAEATQEIIQEQITRVLLERLIVNRPHPWGLLITFIELIKNPRYSFWNHSFTRCAPEIERLFESVARSCMGPSSSKTEDQ